jgi:hypothetical protein
MTNKMVLPDKCPKCGGEMEKGYVPVMNRGLQWSTKKHKWMADSYWQESVESLTGDFYRLTVRNLEAYLCRKCRVVALEY